MAIRHFFEDREAAEKCAEKYGGSVEVCGSSGFVVEHSKGCVVDTYGRDWRAMSDVYATRYFADIWDESEEAPGTVVYGDSFELSSSIGSAEVDASEEIKGKFEAYREGVKAARAVNDAFEAAEIPHEGARVRVVRKLKRTPRGTEGTVFWVGRGKPYVAWGTAPMRCGFKTDDGTTHWVNFPSVEVIDYAREGAPPAPAAPPTGPASVSKGDFVKVVSGRGAGTEGTVIWVGNDRYTGEPRVGVKDDIGNVVWTPAASVASADMAA